MEVEFDERLLSYIREEEEDEYVKIGCNSLMFYNSTVPIVLLHLGDAHTWRIVDEYISHLNYISHHLYFCTSFTAYLPPCTVSTDNQIMGIQYSIFTSQHYRCFFCRSVTSSSSFSNTWLHLARGDVCICPHCPGSNPLSLNSNRLLPA